MVGPNHFPTLLRGRTLAGPIGYTGHGSLLRCDVRAGPYPPLHRGGSPPRNPKKRQKSNLVDEYTRECLVLHASGSLTGADVRRILARVIGRRGASTRIMSDKGSECICVAVV